MSAKESELLNCDSEMSKNATSDVEKIDESNVLPPYVPPDGGWGWVVTFASFLIAALVATPASGFGLIYSSFFFEHKTSSTMIAWIYNVNHFVWSISGILGGPLCAHFGCKNVVAISGALVPVAIILSGFVSRPEYLFVTYSLLAGLGQGLSLISSLILVPKYFEKRRGIAMGISSSGICVGQFIGPLLSSYLLENYGYWGSTLILGGILFHISVAGLVLHPVEQHAARRLSEKNVKKFDEKDTFDNQLPPNSIKDFMNKTLTNRRLSSWSIDSSTVVALSGESYKNGQTHSASSLNKFSIFIMIKSVLKSVIANFKLLKWHRVKILSVACSLFFTSTVNFFMIVPFSLMRDGQPLQLISWTLSLAGFSNMVARLLIATLTDILPFSTRTYCIIGTLGTFVTMNAFTMVLQIEWLLVIMCAYGFCAGTYMGLISLTIIEFMGIEHLPCVLGVEGFCASIVYLVLGPTLGLLRDLTGSYSVVARVSSVAALGACTSWLLLPIASSIDKRKANIEEFEL